MGKDREGRFHPSKGKPSVHTAREQGLPGPGKHAQHADEIPENVPVRNPNRNTSKGEEHFDADENKNFRKDTFSNDVVPLSPDAISPVIDRGTLLELAAFRAPLAISLFMPTHQSGVEVNEQQDASLFKTMMQEIKKELSSRNWEQPAIERMLETGMELLRNDEFWYSQQHGLAVFMAEDHFRYYKMPYTPRQEIHYMDRFFLVPLMEVLNRDESFYLLVFSKKRSVLYKADHYGLEEVEVEDMPKGKESVLHYDNAGSEQLFRSGSSGQGASYHGMGSNVPDEKTQIAIYLEELDEKLMKSVLSTSQLPLVLAAVDYLVPIYKKVSHYKYIAEESLMGNHDAVKENELYRKAKDLMQPYFNSFVEKELEDFNNNIATGITSSIPADIIPACFYGQTKVLFVQGDAHIWGTFDEAANQLVIHDEKEEGDHCLLNEAAVRALSTGGMVYVLEKERMPAESVMAAVMRY